MTGCCARTMCEYLWHLTGQRADNGPSVHVCPLRVPDKLPNRKWARRCRMGPPLLAAAPCPFRGAMGHRARFSGESGESGEYGEYGESRGFFICSNFHDLKRSQTSRPPSARWAGKPQVWEGVQQRALPAESALFLLVEEDSILSSVNRKCNFMRPRFSPWPSFPNEEA
jgi:hypothetical protein